MTSTTPDRLRSFSASFGGIPCAQYFVDFFLWEVVLNEHPDVVAVYEIGSWQGGLSGYLEAQCRVRGISFWCCDVVEPTKPVEGFVNMDIWRHKHELVEELQSHGGPIILFCDNGNKPRELREFTFSLPEGSVVMVHDWGTEVLETDVPDWLEEHMGSLCDELGSITRVFTVKP